MIVCICNCIKESDIRAKRDAGTATSSDLFRSFDCEPRCATCVPEIEELLQPAYSASSSSPAAN